MLRVRPLAMRDKVRPALPADQVDDVEAQVARCDAKVGERDPVAQGEMSVVPVERGPRAAKQRQIG